MDLSGLESGEAGFLSAADLPPPTLRSPPLSGRPPPLLVGDLERRALGDA